MNTPQNEDERQPIDLERAYRQIDEEAEAARKAQEREAEAKRKAYEAFERADAYEDEFVEQITHGMEKLVKTYQGELDAKLGGGVFPGLYIVGAESSLGKTAFCMQIADGLAAGGQDVLYFSFEMSRRDLIARSIARNTFLYAVANGNTNLARNTFQVLTNNGITNGSDEMKRNSNLAYCEYFKGDHAPAKHLYFVEVESDLTEDGIYSTVENHIETTGRRPVVFVDYLQLISPSDERASDLSNINRAIKRLRQLARDKDIIVFLISAFNRVSYNQKAEMNSFRGSSGIEYGADCLIGLNYKGQGDGKGFNIDEARKGKDQNGARMREIEARLLKNRLAPTGETAYFDYYPAYNLFVGQGEEIPAPADFTDAHDVPEGWTQATLADHSE